MTRKIHASARTMNLKQKHKKQKVARTSVTSCESRDDQPPKELEEVVRERDEVEAVPSRNGAFAASCRPEGTELDVSNKIRDFGELKAGRY